MHIVILSDAIDNQNAGVHFYTKNLIENLLKIDNNNEYSFIHCQKNDFYKNTKNHIVPQKKGPGTESYRRFIQIPNLIKKINPDIVLQPCHIGPFRIPKHIKRAVTIHDLTPITHSQFHTLRGIVIHKLFLKRTLKNADLILTPSHTTKNDIQKNYEANALFQVTPLGIDYPKTTTHHSLNINAPYILYLGTIEPRKNLEILIDTFLELKDQNKIPHKLVIAGAIGWKSKKTLKKTKHKDIILTGYLTKKEKAAYYTHADMFVYPSIYEGFGLPPLEAMSYGIPVICSTGGSLKEFFSNNALTFGPKDKQTLKKHILNLHNSPKLKRQLIEKGLQYVKNFTWKKTARKTLEAFEKAVNQ